MPRIGSSKSKTGCTTCKVRRVKCTEERPECRRCTTTGRRCEYSLDNTHHTDRRHDKTSLSSNPCSVTSTPERRAFEFYFHAAAPGLSGVLDLSFWRGTVLQICRSEPAIWDAINSLSVLYEDGLNPRGIQWYLRSLAVFQEKIARGTIELGVALVSCALFVAIEVLQGNFSSSLVLFHQGVQLIGSVLSSSSSSSSSSMVSSTVETVAPVLLRMGTLPLIAAGPLTQKIQHQHIPVSFTSIAEARMALYSIVQEVRGSVSRKRKKDKNSKETLEEQIYRLLCWHQQFLSLPALPDPEYASVVSTILMTYLSAWIWVNNHNNTASEEGYDQYIPQFKQIIAHAATALSESCPLPQSPFVFEMGVGLSLFITAIKCRDASLRRQAIEYLSLAPKVQGMYRCEAAREIAEKIVDLEENGRRVCDFMILQGDNTRLRCFLAGCEREILLSDHHSYQEYHLVSVYYHG
ncbi:hypothetical protein ASPZODRAFT_24897 [Penicilliopsis zonata CBS 506.65]|uniref:Zn(2)-C6 fungal-type domain-containing protein n=1 Tax=Penicilliopsis zonata CBS 506.65 TaxID=1073090 RepID=A0A1L9SLL0_9EURO|nr:hypothetical protein ASPZODRAFT_24897 [Penicilliopsis zonata CBS 506.65]OJJ48023.1 hypothetical protein ASPZODRAFT_24897 [Penicilliopsis zonata CBS 506.65]